MRKKIILMIMLFCLIACPVMSLGAELVFDLRALIQNIKNTITEGERWATKLTQWKQTYEHLMQQKEEIKATVESLKGLDIDSLQSFVTGLNKVDNFLAQIQYADATVEGSVQRTQSNVNELYNKAENLDTDWENEYTQFVKNSETYRNWMVGKNAKKLRYDSQAAKWKRMLEESEKEIADINEQIKEVKDTEKIIRDEMNDVSEKVRELSDKMTNITSTANVSTEQREQYKAQIENYETRFKVLQENLSKYGEYVEKLKGSLITAEKQKIRAESRIEHFELMAKKQDEIIEKNKQLYGE